MKTVNASGLRLNGTMLSYAKKLAKQALSSGRRPFSKTSAFPLQGSGDILLFSVKLGDDPSLDKITITNGNQFRILSATVNTVTWAGGRAPFIIELQYRNPAGDFLDSDTTDRAVNVNTNLTDGVGDIVTEAIGRTYTITKAAADEGWWADDLTDPPQDAIGLSITDSSEPARKLFAPFTPASGTDLADVYSHYGPGTWCVPEITYTGGRSFTYGTPLAVGQGLTASAHVPGSTDNLPGVFHYWIDADFTVPAEGATPGAGTFNLYVTLQATDAVHYHLSSTVVVITISKAVPFITLTVDRWDVTGMDGDTPMKALSWHGGTGPLITGSTGKVTAVSNSSGFISYTAVNPATATINSSGDIAIVAVTNQMQFMVDVAEGVNHLSARLEGGTHYFNGTSPTHAATGGIVLDGTASTVAQVSHIVASGIVMAGSAAVSAALSYIAAGGLVASGDAAVAETRPQRADYAAAGSLVLSGTAAVLRANVVISSHAATGAIIASGAAVIIGSVSACHTASGSIVVSGVAIVVETKTKTPNITWPSPATLEYPYPLSAFCNRVRGMTTGDNSEGVFVFSMDGGTTPLDETQVLNVDGNTNIALSYTFTPFDPTAYSILEDGGWLAMIKGTFSYVLGATNQTVGIPGIGVVADRPTGRVLMYNKVNPNYEVAILTDFNANNSCYVTYRGYLPYVKSVTHDPASIYPAVWNNAPAASGVRWVQYENMAASADLWADIGYEVQPVLLSNWNQLSGIFSIRNWNNVVTMLSQTITGLSITGNINLPSGGWGKVSAKASSGLKVGFQVNSTAVTINNSTSVLSGGVTTADIFCVSPGTIFTITAIQNGNASYNPAAPVTIQLVVKYPPVYFQQGQYLTGIPNNALFFRGGSGMYTFSEGRTGSNVFLSLNANQNNSTVVYVNSYTLPACYGAGSWVKITDQMDPNNYAVMQMSSFLPTVNSAITVCGVVPAPTDKGTVTSLADSWQADLVFSHLPNWIRIVKLQLWSNGNGTFYSEDFLGGDYSGENNAGIHVVWSVDDNGYMTINSGDVVSEDYAPWRIQTSYPVYYGTGNIAVIWSYWKWNPSYVNGDGSYGASILTYEGTGILYRL